MSVDDVTGDVLRVDRALGSLCRGTGMGLLAEGGEEEEDEEGDVWRGE